ncbi:multidrug transporter [Xanthomonas phaseoli pv. phaseoli]|uniref:efflux transporter outer membrane subunit n=1 Tax=Xanthomonas phaseoli TaxID=1985254 RepID=UPI00057497AC|nr:efflux transporter outer membrane subunit [Xanthomonas phaseoli]KHS05483.1 multidrug transporter [Xanthomonas phaseoli pv. phaseoli]
MRVSRNVVRSLLAASVLLASGCTLQPHYVRPPDSVSQSYPDGPAYQSDRSWTSSRGDDVLAADIGWREFFKDARLQALIEIALTNNRDLQVSMLNMEAARAQYGISRSQVAPTVDLDASATRQRNPSNVAMAGAASGTAYSVGLGTAWELDLFGRLRSLKDSALAGYLALAETRKAAELSLMAQVAVQYLTILADDEQLAVTQGTLESAHESYRITKLSFDNGIGSELDLQQSRGVLEQVSASLEYYQRVRAQDENFLVLLLGQALPADLPSGLPLEDQAQLADIPAGLPSDLLQRKPDIIAAEHALLAANANIGAARAAFFPTLSLTGTAGTLSSSTDALFTGTQRSWSFVPQLTLPIFRGGANAASLDLAHVRKRIEIANYQRVIQSAFREVADGLAARRTYDRQITYLKQYQRTQSRRLELSDMRYRHGVDGYLSVLQSQTDLFDAQQDLVAARLARASNLVMLYKSLGGGWVERSGQMARAPTDTHIPPTRP